ncbi:hypothetical protein Q7P37_008903 [Cladosporium fusiforme]
MGVLVLDAGGSTTERFPGDEEHSQQELQRVTNVQAARVLVEEREFWRTGVRGARGIWRALAAGASVEVDVGAIRSDQVVTCAYSGDPLAVNATPHAGASIAEIYTDCPPPIGG